MKNNLYKTVKSLTLDNDIAFACLDEIDAVEFIKPFTRYRLFLKIGTLPFILFGRFDYAISIWIFDIAYEATKKGLEKIR
jgi:phosphatidylglycerophosphatase A